MPRPPKTVFARPRRIEAMYRFEIDDVVSRVLRIPSGLDLDGIVERLLQIGGLNHFSEKWAEKISRNMVSTVSLQNERSWRAAASKYSRGRQIYEGLRTEQRGPVGEISRDLVSQSALLVRRIPTEVALQANHYIAAEQMKGRRADDIARDLYKRLPEMKRSHVDLIARTQVTTAATAITQARSAMLNIRWYQWLTSEDARVRPAHAKMDLVLVPWAEPPSPEALIGIRSTLGHYHAGNCPNCRCDPAPVVDLGEIRWPARVYWQGSIQRMGRGAFLKLAA